MPAGAYFTERIPLVGAGLSATTSVDVLEPVGEPEGLDVRGLDDVDGGLVEAVADRIALAMGGRHLDPATPGGAVALETARDVIGMARLGVYEPAQPDVDPAGAADLVARQCVADLAGALGLNEPRPWPDMCREVRAHRHVAEDGEAERVKTATALGMPRPTADQPTPSWRAIRAQARRARDLGGESFVSALRNVLDDCGPGVADMTRPELLGQVRRLVGQSDRLARLVGDDPARVQLDSESLERALRAHWDAHRVTTAWENAPGPDQERELRAVERIICAYLADPEG